MGDFPSPYGPDVKWHLTVRAEQPIAGCELTPHPYLKLKSQTLDNPTKARLQESNPHTYIYKWYRGPKKDPCANNNCHRNHDFSPMVWATTTTSGPNVICAVCERGGVPRYNITFCSLSCFKGSWKEHSPCHATLTFPQKSEILKKATTVKEMIDYVENVEEAEPPPFSDEDYAISSADWVLVCSGAEYVPQPDDVGRVLKIECSAIPTGGEGRESIAGPVTVYTAVVLGAPQLPPSRSIKPLVNSGWPLGVSTIGKLRVITYNILAEVYATRQMYPRCDSWSLSWAYRRSILFKELEKADADVLCLQEVQADHFDRDIRPFLDSLGYSGHYDQKTREAMGQVGKIDGCAIFYRRSKMRLAETYVIKYNDCVMAALSQHTRMDEQSINRYIARLSKDNVAQVVVLEMIPAPGTSGGYNGAGDGSSATGLPPRSAMDGVERPFVCIVNTHLYSNHMFPDVKLWQTVSLLNELENFVTQRNLPFILCGDFNSEPHSAVYQYLSQGAVDGDHPDLENVSTKMLPGLESSRHSMELLSAMQTAYGQEPLYTNYTSNFKGTLDYIWFSPGRLRPISYIELPEESELSRYSGGLPNAAYPSDHVYLCCEFAIASANSNIPNPYHGSGGLMMPNPSSRSTRRVYSTSPPLPSSAKKPSSSRNPSR